MIATEDIASHSINQTPGVARTPDHASNPHTAALA